MGGAASSWAIEMVEIAKEKRSSCIPLFVSVPIWRAFIESAVEDEIGKIIADDEDSPTVAALFYGGVLIYSLFPQSDQEKRT